LHEQNAVMGTANRWLARIAQQVMVSFPNTKYAPQGARLIGNPVRTSIASLPSPQLRYADRKGPLRMLVVGGSLGASALNRELPQAFARAAAKGQAIDIRHQTGLKELEDVKARYRELKLDAQCSAFIHDMDAAYSWADLIICRAGASTVTEVAAAGVAAVFVPLPSAIDDHQTANARFLAAQDAAWLMPQSPAFADQMADLLASCHRDGLALRAQAARALAMQAADAKAADIVATASGMANAQGAGR
jgi:UDP-N-acetylglucosamine--N-acetylmuramyl-(pentapeptide) pyrophosphoryl-undecaprenol N-acetylglucosamine transferase